MAVEFKKPKQNRIFQHVVEEIQTAILDGRLKPGDLLPSEMKLKDLFGTSRGTIREALRVLEQKGLVETKVGVGGGAFVREVDTRSITESLDLLIQSRKISLGHLVEFRREVEGIVTGFAVERATEADIKHLKGYLVKARRLLDQENTAWKDFIKIDVQLHIAIAEIAGNPVFLAILHMVHENILGYYERFSLKDKPVLKENYNDLYNIVEAIERKQVSRARLLSQKHVEKFMRYMEENE